MKCVYFEENNYKLDYFFPNCLISAKFFIFSFKLSGFKLSQIKMHDK